MNNDMPAQQLHDKMTRGGTLTEVEQAALEAWYERVDKEEAAQLAAFSLLPLTLENLRLEVSAAVKQLNEVTQRIQAQSDENEKLRQENAALSRRLVKGSQVMPFRSPPSPPKMGGMKRTGTAQATLLLYPVPPLLGARGTLSDFLHNF